MCEKKVSFCFIFFKELPTVKSLKNLKTNLKKIKFLILIVIFFNDDFNSFFFQIKAEIIIKRSKFNLKI